MPARDDRPTLTLAHSPDPDDAFMWWPLEGEIDTGPVRFRLIRDDIQSLNERAVTRGDLDVTAISIHAYPHARGRYALTSMGSSMGDGYGPRIVAREPRGEGWGWLAQPGVRIATPGRYTTAHLVMRLMLAGAEPDTVETPFDRILEAVASGEADAGLVIHEGQLTYADAGLSLIADLGVWWRSETGLPLPLGGNAVRRDLDERFGEGVTQAVLSALARSLTHAMSEREESLSRALACARGLSEAAADEFVSMYVNPLTIDAGARGAEAISLLLGKAHALGLCPDPGPIEMLRPAPAAPTR
ncbi:MAG: ABC transporter substrate-binding protein [Planctomycetota bacterium]|nr:MAG: ABC transporter substrate-binding protein [Planctomycetota bacterium]